MSQSLVLQAKGIETLNNPLSSATPQGSLAEALNVIIDRNDVIEPRRGFAQYGTSFGTGTDRTKQLFDYKDVIIRHVLNQLQYDSDGQGTFEAFNGPAITEVETGLRLKGIEANGNFYFTTSTGVKKISALTSADFPNISITEAGGVKALDLTATPDYSQAGFLAANSKTAYRIVWGYKDLNDNLILGSPSSRQVVFNVTTSSCVVDLLFSVPADVTSEIFFYQVYRTGVFSATPPTEPADPGDEMNLVFEDNVTSSQITSGVVQVTDITPEDFRKNGTLLYTNPESGDGIESANEKPPFAKDLALYKGYTFYANTRTVQRLGFSFLSVTGMTTNSSTLSISDGTHTNTYTFQGSIETFTVNYTGTLASDFHNTSPGTAKYFTLTAAGDARTYCVWYNQSANDEEPSLPGVINIQVTTLSGDTVANIITKTITAMENATDDFNLSVSGTVITAACSNNGAVTIAPTENIADAAFIISKDGLGTGEDVANNKIFLPRVPTGTEFGPTTSQQLEQVATSLVRVMTQKDDIVYAYYISGFDDIPGQIQLEQQDTTGPAFYLNSNVGNQFNPTIPVSGKTVISTNEIRPNRLYYSKFQQPEAVPLANYVDIGPQDREIKRILALRDSLLVFKEDGIYRVSSDTAPFVIAPLDFSAQVLAPDTAVILNNQVYALSTQGVITVTDNGVSVISRPIENQLLRILREGFNYKSASFGVTYETDRSYLLWTVTNSGDTVATQCFRYNTFTLAWTRWDISKTCGIVNFADDKLYLGAGDLNQIEKERKSLTRSDYADREFILSVILNGVNETSIELSSVANIEVGDVLLQKQYLTASQFNRILQKLDNDIQVGDHDYFSLLHFTPGQNMRAKLESLATKLDNDPGINDNDYSQSIGNYSYSASAISAANQTVLTIGAHNLEVNRFITIAGSDSVPSIDGTFQVIAVGSTTITINKAVTVAGTTASVQTDIDNFQDMQACYNIISNKLDLDTGAFYTNYPISSGTSDVESVVVDTDKNTNVAMVQNNLSLLNGNITLYKAIYSKVIWNPQYFGDPSVEKQIREGTMMFENGNFSLVTLSYATDRAPSYIPTIFNGKGIGDWGEFSWGSVNWGGVAAPTPLRTYIPREKQRCRFMNVKFEHKVALEKYSSFGISLTYRAYNIRTTR